MPSTLPTAAQIIALHDHLLASAGWPQQEPAPRDDGLWRWVQTNHLYNCRLWAEEDLARRTKVWHGKPSRPGVGSSCAPSRA